MILGITGSIAMGKTTVTTMLQDMEELAVYYDADKENHYLLQHDMAVISQIQDQFGAGILHDDGTVNRQALGACVFNNKQALQRLEAIIHPVLAQKRAHFIETHKTAPLIILDVPLLFEAGIDKECDKTICVYCDEYIQKKRLFMRPNMDNAKWQAIKKRQMPSQDKIQKADYAIDTGLSLEATKEQVHNIYCQLRCDNIK